MSYYYGNTFADIYGLKSTDLTDEQLKKIDHRKLIECATQDSRAEKILVESINNFDKSTFSYLYSIDKEKFDNIVCFKEKYREFVRTIEDSGLIKVGWLQLEDQANETQKWVDGQRDRVNAEEVDIEGLCEKYEELSVLFIQKQFDHYYCIPEEVIRKISKNVMNKTIDMMYKKYKSYKTSDVLLANRHIPTKYAVDCLLDVIKRKHSRVKNAIIKEQYLKAITPLNALKVMEKFLYNGRYFGSVNLSATFEFELEQLHLILFPVAFKYNERVVKVNTYFVDCKNQQQKLKDAG